MGLVLKVLWHRLVFGGIRKKGSVAFLNYANKIISSTADCFTPEFRYLLCREMQTGCFLNLTNLPVGSAYLLLLWHAVFALAIRVKLGVCSIYMWVWWFNWGVLDKFTPSSFTLGLVVSSFNYYCLLICRCNYCLGVIIVCLCAGVIIVCWCARLRWSSLCHRSVLSIMETWGSFNPLHACLLASVGTCESVSSSAVVVACPFPRHDDRSLTATQHRLADIWFTATQYSERLCVTQ